MNLSNLSQQLNRNCIFSGTCWNQIPLTIISNQIMNCVPVRSKRHASFSALIYSKFLTKEMFLCIAKYFFYILNLFIRCDIYNNKMWLGTWHTAFFLFYMVLMMTWSHKKRDFVLICFCIFTTQPECQNFNTFSERSEFDLKDQQNYATIARLRNVVFFPYFSQLKQSAFILQQTKNNPVSNDKYLTFSLSLFSLNFLLHLLICRPCPACDLSWGRRWWLELQRWPRWSWSGVPSAPRCAVDGGSGLLHSEWHLKTHLF